jgi:hypothetical protein
MEENNHSRFVGIITTNGIREFVLYSMDPEETKIRFEKLKNEITSHQIQLMIRQDKD